MIPLRSNAPCQRTSAELRGPGGQAASGPSEFRFPNERVAAGASRTGARAERRLRPRRDGARAAGPHGLTRSLREVAAGDAAGNFGSSDGGPSATIAPAGLAPPGPSSMIQSDAARKSRWCSIARTECPREISRRSVPKQDLDVAGMEAGRRLVEEEEAPRGAAGRIPRNDASFRRWASPPESVAVGWPSGR